MSTINSASPQSPFASSDGDGDLDMDVDGDADSPDAATNGARSDHDATPRPEPINESAPVNIMPLLGRLEQRMERYDVCIVGAGPAGLMLGLILARLGITPLILDERAEQTPAGRADGMQPKTIETLRMLNLADELLQQGVKVYDICLWHSASASSSPPPPDEPPLTPATPGRLRRVGRETHYPAFIVDLADPFILIGHQGMVERAFVADLAKRGISVRRCHRFEGLDLGADDPHGDGMMEVRASFNVTRAPRSFRASYLVGCDGAHSRVRKLVVPAPGTTGSGEDEDEDMGGGGGESSNSSSFSAWGVLDGEVDTDFPDIWTKTVVFSESSGSILIMPRERDMTRLYIEMRPDAATGAGGLPADANLVQAAIMRRAAQILLPYRIRWRRVEWFGQYRVSQRVAPRFAAQVPHVSTNNSNDNTTATATTGAHHPEVEPRIFLAGDAAHTHSPKAAQGMNTALHDSWNLAWKLNLAARGLCRPAVLLASYEAERRKIARDLVAFDFEHANELSRGDPAALADNFRRNVRFISGVGVEYGENALNTDGLPAGAAAASGAGARPGCTLPPGKVSRYIDANPVDVQLDIPVLGQFRIYMFVPDVAPPAAGAAFLRALCGGIAEDGSLLSRLSAAASKSYLERPRVPSSEDLFIRPERYTAVSQLFVFSLITTTPKPNFELCDLPPVLSRSPWTIYLDDVPDLDTQGSTCTVKYLGSPDVPEGFQPDHEVAILNVRPDGYVGSVKKWSLETESSQRPPEEVGREAAAWLEAYFDRFLAVPG